MPIFFVYTRAVSVIEPAVNRNANPILGISILKLANEVHENSVCKQPTHGLCVDVTLRSVVHRE